MDTWFCVCCNRHYIVHYNTPHVFPYIFHSSVRKARLDWKKKIRSSPPEVFFDFIEITFRHGCSLVNWLQLFRIQLPKNTSREFLLNKKKCIIEYFASWNSRFNSGLEGFFPQEVTLSRLTLYNVKNLVNSNNNNIDTAF